MQDTAEFSVIYCPFGYDNPERKQWSLIRFEDTPTTIKIHTISEHYTRQDAVIAAKALHLDVA